jgi:hypothetical protein
MLMQQHLLAAYLKITIGDVVVTALAGCVFKITGVMLQQHLLAAYYKIIEVKLLR